jgi:protein required for attachment to host cells
MAARIWALVIDPMRARVLRGFDGMDGEEPVEFISQASSVRMRAIISGEESNSIGEATMTEAASTQTSDAIAQDTADFLRETMTFLETQHRAHHFERLAVFADPAILSSIDTQLSAQLRDGLILHPARRLMSLPETTLHRRLRELIDQSDTQSGDGPRNQGSD